MSRSRLALLVVLSLACVLPSSVRAQQLSDSTIVTRWRLANGLEVRTRHVPGAGSVAIAMAYRAGSAQFPPQRDGMAELLAELEFTSAAGDVPERTRQELPSLRPQGWDVRVNDHIVVLTEVARPEQFPGVLRQVATRARGVQPSETSLRTAMASVRGDLGRERFGDVEPVLYYRLREVARGLDDAAILRKASIEPIKDVSLRDAAEQLRRLYVPANASLALVGDFSKLDVRALVEREFGGIPGGVSRRDTAATPLRAAARTTVREGLPRSFAAIGVLAPSLDDTLHASFFLAALVVGTWWSEQQHSQSSALKSYFQYSIFDEPDMVRLELEPEPTVTDAGQLSDVLNVSLGFFTTNLITDTDYNAVRRSVTWLLGGPLPPALVRQAHTDPGTLARVAFVTASRACWRGDAFWDRYRRRFENGVIDRTRYTLSMLDPKRQALLLLRPKH